MPIQQKGTFTGKKWRGIKQIEGSKSHNQIR